MDSKKKYDHRNDFYKNIGILAKEKLSNLHSLVEWWFTI